MWCELVMLPPNLLSSNAAAGHVTSTPSLGAHHAASTSTTQSLPQVLTGATHPYAANSLTSLQFQTAIPTAVTGLPINKDLKLSTVQTNILASQLAAAQKIDTTNHFHIFVGDLAPEIETNQLRDTFSAFGVVTECKIIKDMHTQKPKGYGFIAYATREEAEDALTKMNGRMLGSRTIRTNWAVRRPQQNPVDQKPLNFDEVCNAASVSNCTVYVGGITKGLCEDVLREAFVEFGKILEVRVFKEKGYAFVRFDNHEGATRAIITMHGQDICGQACKCSWGKESSEGKDVTAQQLLQALSYVPPSVQPPPLSYPINPLSYLQPQISFPASYTNVQNTNGFYG